MALKTATVEKAVREALQAVRPDIGLIDGDADLMSDVGLDSVQVMDLIMEIEDRLDVSVPVETLADAHTLDQLCAGIVQLADGTPHKPA